MVGTLLRVGKGVTPEDWLRIKAQMISELSREGWTVYADTPSELVVQAPAPSDFDEGGKVSVRFSLQQILIDSILGGPYAQRWMDRVAEAASKALEQVRPDQAPQRGGLGGSTTPTNAADRARARAARAKANLERNRKLETLGMNFVYAGIGTIVVSLIVLEGDTMAAFIGLGVALAVVGGVITSQQTLLCPKCASSEIGKSTELERTETVERQRLVPNNNTGKQEWRWQVVTLSHYIDTYTCQECRHSWKEKRKEESQ